MQTRRLYKVFTASCFLLCHHLVSCKMGGGGRLLLGVVCAGLMTAVAVANAAAGEAATSVVVGLAQCADCSRKNMNAEAAFKGLQVAIKCKNGNGEQEYESKAVGELDGSGAFAVPLAANLRGADCFAQLHSAASVPCPGQEPSKIVPLSEGTFVAVAGKTTHHPSAECASATICYPCHKKHLLFGHKPFFMHRRMKPVPEYQPPTPEYGTPTPECPPPAPEYGTPTPVLPPPAPEYGTPTPECPPPAPEYGSTPMPESPPPTAPVYGTPTPKCQCSPPTPEYPPPTPEYPPPTPEYRPPTPEYPPPTPEYGTPTPRCPHTAPVYGQPAPECPPSAPEYGTPPTPECPPTTPEYGTPWPTPVYTPPGHH